VTRRCDAARAKLPPRFQSVVALDQKTRQLCEQQKMRCERAEVPSGVTSELESEQAKNRPVRRGVKRPRREGAPGPGGLTSFRLGALSDPFPLCFPLCFPGLRPCSRTPGLRPCSRASPVHAVRDLTYIWATQFYATPWFATRLRMKKYRSVLRPFSSRLGRFQSYAMGFSGSP
jgi:hypothetical protein